VTVASLCGLGAFGRTGKLGSDPREKLTSINIAVHSYLNATTGFLPAALAACPLTVTQAIQSAFSDAAGFYKFCY